MLNELMLVKKKTNNTFVIIIQKTFIHDIFNSV